MNTVQVTDEVQEYLDSLLPPRDPVLARIEEEAHRENIPIVDAHEGAFLSLLVRIAGQPHTIQKVHPLCEPGAVDTVCARAAPEIGHIDEGLRGRDKVVGCRETLREAHHVDGVLATDVTIRRYFPEYVRET